MIRTVLTVEGMACPMCESHVNDAVRGAFAVKRVSSSYRKGETEIVSAEPLDEAALRRAIEATGYRVTACRSETAERKGLFGLLK